MSYEDTYGPQPGQLWRHYKGGLYSIVEGRALLERDGDKSATYVVYRSLNDHRVWVRDREQFFDTVEVDGKKVPRFVRVLA